MTALDDPEILNNRTATVARKCPGIGDTIASGAGDRIRGMAFAAKTNACNGDAIFDKDRGIDLARHFAELVHAIGMHNSGVAKAMLGFFG